MTVTRDDVARRAGVSTAVVSYVVNDGPRPVSVAKRQRVLDAIAELGYRRDAVAAALSSRRRHALGLLLPDASNPFFADLARRIEDAAFTRGYTVLIGNAAEDRDREARHLETFLAHRVDGVIAILADVESALPVQLDALAERAVLVDRAPAAWRGRAVTVDNRAGGRLAAAHLAARCSAVVVLAGPTGFAHVAERVAGFREALPPGVDCRTVAAEDFGFAAGRAALAEALASGQPDGAFCCTDSLAIGAISALAAAGLAVPRDVAVVGYDDVALAAVAVPPLTTVAQPVEQIAEQALELLLGEPGARCALLQPRLVVRESA